MIEGSGPSWALVVGVILLLLVLLTGFVVVRRRGEDGRGVALKPPLPDAPPADAPPDAPPIDAESALADAPPVDAPPADAPAVDAESALVDAPPVDAPPADAPAVDAESALVDAPPGDTPVEPDVQPAEEEPAASTGMAGTELLEKPARGRVRSLRDRLSGLFGRGSLSDSDLLDLEEVLLRADVGTATTADIIAGLRQHRDMPGMDRLRTELRQALGDPDRSLRHKDDGLTVWLITGVNGSGKTTTIGKLAAQATGEGKSVVLAAADTFRAAADEQLEVWASRADADVVKHQHGADPAAVVFDGVKSAKAKNAKLLIVDTAGRLQSKANLMEELSKIKRVLDREAGPPDEVLLIIDATTGQNGMSQARAFAEAAGVTGIVLTKLDGSAKGGIVIAVQRELGIPVKLVGLGEGLEDLAPFDPDSFIDDLLA